MAETQEIDLSTDPLQRTWLHPEKRPVQRPRPRPEANEEAENAYNPGQARDSEGKWTDGGGSYITSKSDTKQINAAAKRLAVDGKLEAHSAFQKMGYNGLPQLVAGNPQGKMLFRWENGRNKSESTKFRNEMMNVEARHLPEARIFGSGTYFGQNLNGIKDFRNGKGSVKTKVALDKSAKVITFGEVNQLRSKMLHQNLTPQGEALIRDQGLLASAMGYDAMVSNSGVMIVMNRTKMVFGDQE